MSAYEPSVARPLAGVLATNKLIKNTYILLSLTLLFSAMMAGVAMATNAPPLMTGWLGVIIWMGAVFGLTMVINAMRNSAWALLPTFALTGFLGYTLGPILSLYLALPNGSQIVMTALGITAITFLGLSGYALTTRRDFSFMRGFLMAGMIVAVVAIIANLFLHVAALSLAISSVVVLLMAGMILHDTSRMVNGGETNYIMATVGMYLNIYNMFIHLLSLVAALSGDN